MSAVVESCASCGVVGSDDIKLRRCNACYLVRYCSVKCQKDHRPQHKKECKRRAAELRDEILFKQPESTHLGDCPICCFPLSIDVEQSILMSCCGKVICMGCDYANQKREVLGRLEQKCAFCRSDYSDTQEDYDRRLMKRIDANDPVALCNMGAKRKEEGDYTAAFEYWAKSAALGDVDAHYQLSILYHDGRGVERDKKRALNHMEQAAIEGHPFARYNLGLLEKERGRHERAVKHFIIAAKLGFDKSLETVTSLYKDGFVSKDDFATALRGHKAAIDATKSPQRQAAELAERKSRGPR